MNSALVSLPISTADGIFFAHYSDLGLAELDWPASHRTPKPPAPAKPIPPDVLHWHRLAESALINALSNKSIKCLPPLDWSDKTEFQKAVWRVMLSIPRGHTLSYGDVAHKIHRPKAVRAVGNACGANPIPVLVPCHRILAANRKIGGFSGGLHWKHRLLALEGVDIAGPF